MTAVEKTLPYTTERQNEDLCNIYDLSYVPPVAPDIPDNECECTDNGTCNTDTLACSCASGYTGQKCQFLESEIDQLISTTNTAISDVTQNYGSMQPVEALSQAAFLSAAPDLVTTDSF